jgi:hypothetical protein
MSREALAEGISTISAEASGVMNLAIVRPIDAVMYLAEAIAGSADAARVFRSVTQAQAGIKKAERRKPMLCASCPRALRKNAYTFAVTLPRCDDPTQALTMAVCHHCGTDLEVTTAKALGALRLIWPNLRPIVVTHADGGHA